jgi:hypothetical protein
MFQIRLQIFLKKININNSDKNISINRINLINLILIQQLKRTIILYRFDKVFRNLRTNIF